MARVTIEELDREELKVRLRACEIVVLAMAGLWREYRGSAVEPAIADALAEQVAGYERARAALAAAASTSAP